MAVSGSRDRKKVSHEMSTDCCGKFWSSFRVCWAAEEEFVKTGTRNFTIFCAEGS